MPRTTLPIIDAPGSYPTLPLSANSRDIVFTAGDAGNNNQFLATGREIVIVQNSGAGARTVTFLSVADRFGRTGDMTAYSLGAGEFGLFGPFQLDGWRQTDGYVYTNPEHAEIKYAVIRLPSVT